MKSTFRSLLNRPYIIVLSLWFFFQFLWYVHFGFVFELEAHKYMVEANYILKYHAFSQFRFLFYFTTIAIIALSFTLRIGAIGALLIIMAINLAAYLYFFFSLKKFFGQSWPAFVIVLLLLSFWPYQSWSLFLYTECMFYSMVLLLFGHLLQFKKLTFRFVAITFLLLLVLLITRPLGILFGLPVLLFIAVHLSKRHRFYLFIAGVAFAFLLNYIVHVFFTTTSDWSMTYALTGDMIICDVPQYNTGYHPQLSTYPNQLYQLGYYLLHNFPHFLQLATKRLFYFFTMMRPYYSVGHNVYLGVYDVLFYGSILWNFKQIKRSTSSGILVFVFSSIFLFALACALECDEWHSRFFLTLTPFFVTLTVIGWKQHLQRIVKTKPLHTHD